MDIVNFYHVMVFYSKYERSSRTMYTFRKDFLKTEEKDYIMRYEDDAKFRRIRNRMGTTSVITNMKASGKIVYDTLKFSHRNGAIIRYVQERNTCGYFVHT